MFSQEQVPDPRGYQGTGDRIFVQSGQGWPPDALNVAVENFLWIVAAVMFKQCANVDYYRKTVLNRMGWR